MIVVKNDRCQKFKPEISTLTETSSSEKAAITFQVGITRKHYFANPQIEVQDNMTRLAIYPETLTSTSLIRLAEQLCSAVYTHRYPQTYTCTTVYSACACASMLHIVVLIHSRFHYWDKIWCCTRGSTTLFLLCHDDVCWAGSLPRPCHDKL